MNKIASILRLDFLPASTDLALLVLRLWLGLSLLVLHGWTKLSTFQQMSRKFPDPFGVGSEVSLGLAVFGEVLCSVFLVIGFLTRFAALGAAITMAVAFFIVHGAKLQGSGNGEMAFVYLAGFVTILIAGSGRYAVDGKPSKGAARKPAPPR